MSTASSDLPKLFNNHDLSFYWKMIRWPLFFGFFVNALSLWDGASAHLIPWVTHFVIFGYLAFLLEKRHNGLSVEAFFVGVVVGGLFGFFLSAWRFFSVWQFHLFFNIFAETFLWLVLGGVTTFLFHAVLRWFDKVAIFKSRLRTKE